MLPSPWRHWLAVFLHKQLLIHNVFPKASFFSQLHTNISRQVEVLDGLDRRLVSPVSHAHLVTNGIPSVCLELAAALEQLRQQQHQLPVNLARLRALAKSPLQALRPQEPRSLLQLAIHSLVWHSMPIPIMLLKFPHLLFLL